MSWLCWLSRTFLSLFSPCKSSDLNSRSCSSLSRRKLSTSMLLFFYHQCHFHLAHYVFLSLQIFPLLFSHFLSFLFFVFDIKQSFLSICFCSSNLSIRYSRRCSFSESSSPRGRYLKLLVLFLTCTFPWG